MVPRRRSPAAERGAPPTQATAPFSSDARPRAPHPGVESRTNLKSISHRCHPILVAVLWELTKETIHLPLGCLQGGLQTRAHVRLQDSDAFPSSCIAPSCEKR